jgi:hypothetical protein
LIDIHTSKETLAIALVGGELLTEKESFIGSWWKEISVEGWTKEEAEEKVNESSSMHYQLNNYLYASLSKSLVIS